MPVTDCTSLIGNVNSIISILSRNNDHTHKRRTAPTTSPTLRSCMAGKPCSRRTFHTLEVFGAVHVLDLQSSAKLTTFGAPPKRREYRLLLAATLLCSAAPCVRGMRLQASPTTRPYSRTQSQAAGARVATRTMTLSP